MKIIIKILLLICVSCFLYACGGSSSSSSNNENSEPLTLKVGSAPYAISQSTFQCDKYINSVKDLKELHISILWNTFGGSTDCLVRVMNLPNFKSIQVHLINEVCQRKGNCGSYEFLYGIGVDYFTQVLEKNDGFFISSLRNYAQNVSDFLMNNMKSDTLCYISPGLESNITSSLASKNFISSVKDIFPMCKMVWNPVNGFAKNISNADLVELHGSNPGNEAPCIANLDGEDISFPERPSMSNRQLDVQHIQTYIDINQHCEVVYLWTFEHNCLDPEEFVDPRQRQCQDNNTFELVAEQIRIAQQNR